MLKQLLSHHPTNQDYRCYHFAIFNSDTHWCARCLGIYIGIAGTFIMFRLIPHSLNLVPLIVALHALTILDWIYIKIIHAAGNNFLRTFSGIGIGTSYALAWNHALNSGQYSLLITLYAAYLIIFLYFLKDNLSKERRGKSG